MTEATRDGRAARRGGRRCVLTTRVRHRGALFLNPPGSGMTREQVLVERVKHTFEPTFRLDFYGNCCVGNFNAWFVLVMYTQAASSPRHLCQPIGTNVFPGSTGQADTSPDSILAYQTFFDQTRLAGNRFDAPCHRPSRPRVPAGVVVWFPQPGGALGRADAPEKRECCAHERRRDSQPELEAG